MVYNALMFSGKKSVVCECGQQLTINH